MGIYGAEDGHVEPDVDAHQRGKDRSISTPASKGHMRLVEWTWTVIDDPWSPFRVSLVDDVLMSPDRLISWTLILRH